MRESRRFSMISVQVAVLALVAGLWLGGAIAQAQGVPTSLGYQGRLLNADGTAASGTVTLDFSLYASAAGGTALWSESQAVPLSEGFYSLQLGSVTPIPAGAFDGTLRYLELSIGGTALTPRQVVGSVAYAYQARTLQGGPVNATQVAVGGQSVIDSSGQVAAAAGAAFAPRVHSHAASDIVSGLLGPARGGTGLAGPTATGQVLRASGIGVWAPAMLAASDLPDLSSTYLPLAGGTLTGPLLLEATKVPALAIAGDPGTGIGGPAMGALALLAGGQTLASFSASGSEITNPTSIGLSSQGNLKLGAVAQADLSSSTGKVAITAQQDLNAIASSGNLKLVASAGQATLQGAAGTNVQDDTTVTVKGGASVTVGAPVLTFNGTFTSIAGQVSMPGVAGLPAAGSAVQITTSGQLGVLVSSRRYKEDIADVGDASAAVLRLRPVRFRYRKQFDPEQSQQYGLIAEEVDRVAPELVARDEHGEIQTVKYPLVNALLLDQVQRQHRQLQAQAQRLEAQGKLLAELAARLSTLEAVRARR